MNEDNPWKKQMMKSKVNTVDNQETLSIKKNNIESQNTPSWMNKVANDVDSRNNQPSWMKKNVKNEVKNDQNGTNETSWIKR